MNRPQSILLLALAAVLLGSISGAYAAPESCAPGTDPCYVVKDYWPVKSCKSECTPEICKRGWGAWPSEDICCSPGVAFNEGCGQKLKDCWVVESHALKTCVQDQRKCLQGYGVWPTHDSCCFGAFKGKCPVIAQSAEPCWVVDSYSPARLCKQSTTLCGAEATAAGVQSWATKEACCTIGAAFGEGCSAHPPVTPCWIIDSYNPVRKCRLEEDVAACNRGWGVYEKEEVCCAPNVAFPEGCSVKVSATAAGP